MSIDNVMSEALRTAEALLLSCADGNDDEAIQLINKLKSIHSRINKQDNDLLLNAVNIRDLHGGSPLIYAAKRGLHRTCVALLEVGADTEAALEGSGNTALHLGALHGHTEVVKAILNHCRNNSSKSQHQHNKENPMLPSPSLNNNGDTPLHFSCARGHMVISALLAKAHDQFSPLLGNKTGVTPLMAASSAGHHLCLIALLRLIVGSTRSQTKGSAGANSEEDGHGDVVIPKASQDGGEEVLPILLPISQQDDQGNNALHYACRSGHVGCVKSLLEAGCDAEARNLAGRTPLLEAKLAKNDKAEKEGKGKKDTEDLTGEEGACTCERILEEWHKAHSSKVPSFGDMGPSSGDDGSKKEVKKSKGGKKMTAVYEQGDKTSAVNKEEEEGEKVKADLKKYGGGNKIPAPNEGEDYDEERAEEEVKRDSHVEPDEEIEVKGGSCSMEHKLALPNPLSQPSIFAPKSETTFQFPSVPTIAKGVKSQPGKEVQADMLAESDPSAADEEDLVCPVEMLSELGIKSSHALGVTLDGLSMSQLEALSMFHQRELDKCLEARIRLAREQERDIVSVGIERAIEMISHRVR